MPKSHVKTHLNFKLIWALCGFLITGALAAVSAVQFYQANRSARLAVTIKAKDRYATKPVVVTVMVSNQTMEPLLVNGRMLINQYPLPGELALQIQGPGHAEYKLLKAVVPPDIRESDLVKLPPGQTIEQLADLTDLYGVQKHGKYRIQAIYYNGADIEKDGLPTWRGTIASEPIEIHVD